MHEEQPTHPTPMIDERAQEIALFLMGEYQAMTSRKSRLFLADLAWRIAPKIAQDMPSGKNTRH